MPRSVLAFVPFGVITLVHLAGLWVSSYLVVHLTKPLLMPALIVAFVVCVGLPRGRVGRLTCIALLLSLAGDVLLSMPGELGFLIGLGCFLLAHLTYLALFATVLGSGRPPLGALLLVAWFVILLTLLAPHLGVLLAPVAVYGLVLGGSAAAALTCNRFIAIGAVVFLVSDTMLAFKLFAPGFTFWQIDVVVMALYCAGQGAIVWGVTRALDDGSVIRRLRAATA